MKLNFNGASSLVTGSSFNLFLEDCNILIDLGMFQGLNEQNYNYNELPLDPRKIDIVLLTHSHLDHCGLLPLLVKNGFQGPIYSTVATKQIAEVILLDSAKLQEINYLNKLSSVLIYDTNDALKTLSMFEEISFLEEVSFNNIKFTFLPVGHVLGAASIYIESHNSNFLFSGDIGRSDQAIIKSFNDYHYKAYKPDHIIMESLYGGIQHESRDMNIKQLLNIINETYDSNGVVYIPSFALHRTQEILNILNIAYHSKSIPQDMKIYLDSPMAQKITNIYANNRSEFSKTFNEVNAQINSSDNPFIFNSVKVIKKSKQSRRIFSDKKCIIIAGSGMAEGGRIVNHLYSGLENSNNQVVFVGFQAEGTLGRELVSGIKAVKIANDSINVKAKVHYLRGFSAHGDDQDLKNWLNSFDLTRLKNVFLVHAEPDRLEIFKSEIETLGFSCKVPLMYQGFDL